MVDRARLESECALTGTEGSNPSPSAMAQSVYGCAFFIFPFISIQFLNQDGRDYPDWQDIRFGCF